MDDRSDEAVYAAYGVELVRFAAGLVGPDDAPDVVVEAFLRVGRSPAWTQARDKRALWYRAVVFEARSLHRSTARRQVRERRVATTVPPAAVDTWRDDRVSEALGVLSPQQRAVVMLTYWADLDPPGVGSLLGISAGAVKKQLARARRKLKGELGHG
ncbi:MAG: RNA polymerase sigma factor [Actinomycetota bacterium]